MAKLKPESAGTQLAKNVVRGERATEINPVCLAAKERCRLQQISGERLDQEDFDVYVWLLNRAYPPGAGELTPVRVFVTLSEFQAARGRPREAGSPRPFSESLSKLYSAGLEFETPHSYGLTRLISSFEVPAVECNKSYDFAVVVAPKPVEFLDIEVFLAGEGPAKLNS